jgi:hypothetical protein
MTIIAPIIPFNVTPFFLSIVMGSTLHFGHIFPRNDFNSWPHRGHNLVVLEICLLHRGQVMIAMLASVVWIIEKF